MLKRPLMLVLALVLLLLVDALPGAAQTTDDVKALRKEVEALKEGQAATQKLLQEIQKLLRARPAAEPAADLRSTVVTFAGSPVRGDKQAKLTLVEFSDYQCPFCTRHAQGVLQEIEKEYVKTGKVKYVFRDFPLETIHPKALKAHEAAHCAGEQDKYWEMHDRLFANGPDDLTAHAKALALDMAKFEQCLSSGKHAAKIRQSFLDGQQAGVRGTPTFFVGLADGNETSIKAPQMIVGAQPYAAFKDVLEALLSGPK